MEATTTELPKTVEYKILKEPRVREYFKRMTLKLVSQTQDIDTMFFLDRSARPIAHLYRRVFAALHPDRQKPEIRYLNIGKEKRRALKDSEEDRIPVTKGDFIEK